MLVFFRKIKRSHNEKGSILMACKIELPQFRVCQDKGQLASFYLIHEVGFHQPLTVTTGYYITCLKKTPSLATATERGETSFISLWFFTQVASILHPLHITG